MTLIVISPSPPLGSAEVSFEAALAKNYKIILLMNLQKCLESRVNYDTLAHSSESLL